MNRRMLVWAATLAVAGAGTCGAVETRLQGSAGARLAACIERQVKRADVASFAAAFKTPQDGNGWQTEFWGKYMHYAPRFMAGDAAFRDRLAASVREVLSAQEPDGYLGNYRPALRGCAGGWDVWGQKYTLLGILFWYEATGDEAVLKGAVRLGDWLLGHYGRGGRPLRRTGCWAGLASGSVLEAVVRLYEVTKERRFLDFARAIVDDFEEPSDSLKLVSEGFAGVDVVNRAPWLVPAVDTVNRTGKAYEMMSCYQGLYEFARVADDRRCFDAVQGTANSILKTEVTIAGGASACENWYRGAVNQTLCVNAPQETCVLTTWMRLAATMLDVSYERKWADALEQTFFNAYLGALLPDGSEFAMYSPLAGVRSRGVRQCKMSTNCCNANGPRGFLAYVDAFVKVDDGFTTVNFYSPSRAGDFTVTGDYPFGNAVTVAYGGAAHEFLLRLRCPAWCPEMAVSVNGARIEVPEVNGYLQLRRAWKSGDRVDLVLAMPCRAHVLGDKVAFTRGPLTLARDSRAGAPFVPLAFAGHPEGEYVVDPTKDVPCQAVAAPEGVAAAFELTVGGKTIVLYDYASAGNTFDIRSAYETWLPQQIYLHARDFRIWTRP